ncbi:MAG: 50S ribosome-binding GTPase, partial [Oscillospiraceae bacterium]|nr:50S ribosome-binding GTPase [Oscillospiraceae bacterium]
MNTNASPIQWYPGHMAKARRMMQENLGMVDVLCEILDARIPHASRNPDIDVLAAGKPRVIVLGRADLAEPKRTDEWKQWYEGQGYAVLACDSRSRRGIAGFSPMVRKLLEEKISEWNRKGQSGRKIRLMAAGIPNVGKSTFINSLAGRKAAIAG